MHTSIALWGHPRSISTAVERSFMARGDFRVFHEAFAYVYFMHEQRREVPHKEPNPSHPRSYEAVKAMMEGARRESPVFHKDFAYHVIDHLLEDSSYLKGQVHTFIIRDPDDAVLSHATIHPDLTRDVLGYVELARLFDAVADMTGSAPVVLNASDLILDPFSTISAYCNSIGIPFLAEALTWSCGDRSEWSTWKRWHLDVACSEGFSAPARNYRFGFEEWPHLKAFADYCRPFYDHMNRFRLQIVKEAVQ